MGELKHVRGYVKPETAVRIAYLIMHIDFLFDSRSSTWLFVGETAKRLLSQREFYGAV